MTVTKRKKKEIPFIGNKALVEKYWFDRNLDPVKMTEIRWRCYHDLAFLAECLGYSRFEVEVHGEVWGFFLKKDPTVQPFEKFALSDKTSHDRLLLLPRGGFKSTADIVDMVQYIICWPDIAILIITAKDDLGSDFLGETRGHFVRKEDGSPKEIEGKRSVFQQAFPEFCVDKVGPKSWFHCPASSYRYPEDRKEPTIFFGGVETDMTGYHIDLVKADDSISNENSKTKERIATVTTQRSLHRKMLNPWGYWDDIGTWYNVADAYGRKISAEEKNKTMFWDRGRGESRDTGEKEVITKIMIRPAMWPRDPKMEARFDGDLNDQEWQLWFPNRLTWKHLMKERADSPETFATQFMQAPHATGRVHFSKARMMAATKAFTTLPSIHSGQGIIVQFWDTAYKSQNTWNNYSVGTTCLILSGHFYVIDIVRGRYNDLELPQIMAATVYKWKPKRIAVEDANGVRWLVREVYREMEKVGINGVYFEYLEVKNIKGSKEINTKPFAKALLENRVIFSNAIPSVDAVYDEFDIFPNGETDDIVDSVCSLVSHFQDCQEAIVVVKSTEAERWKEIEREKILYDRIFGVGRYLNAGLPSSEGTRTDQLPAEIAYDPMSEFQ